MMVRYINSIKKQTKQGYRGKIVQMEKTATVRSTEGNVIIRSWTKGAEEMS
jgi:hypothetical protein